MARWLSWEEPDRDLVAVRWHERGVTVVFPAAWARARPMETLIARSRARVAEMEAKAGGRTLIAGSVLVAFSKHEPQPTDQMIDPMAPHDLLRSTP